MLCDWSIVSRTPVSNAPRRDELGEDQEELERVDRADDQVVVAVLAVVEMEAAEAALSRCRSVTICSMLTLCAWWPRSTSTRRAAPSSWQSSELPSPSRRGRSNRTPARRACTRRAARVRLGQRRVDLLQRLDEPLAAGGERVLAGIVRPVGEPERDRVGCGLRGDRDAFEDVVDRRAPHAARPDCRRCRACTRAPGRGSG